MPAMRSDSRPMSELTNSELVWNMLIGTVCFAGF